MVQLDGSEVELEIVDVSSKPGVILNSSQSPTNILTLLKSE